MCARSLPQKSTSNFGLNLGLLGHEIYKLFRGK